MLYFSFPTLNVVYEIGSRAENTHLLSRGMYHCMDDLLFDLFEFDQDSGNTDL